MAKPDFLASHPLTLSAPLLQEAPLELVHLSTNFSFSDIFDKNNGKLLFKKRALVGIMGTVAFSFLPNEIKRQLSLYLSDSKDDSVFEVSKRLGFGSQFIVYELSTISSESEQPYVLKCMRPVFDVNETNKQILFPTALTRQQMKETAKLLKTASSLSKEYSFIANQYADTNLLIPESIFIAVDPVYKRKTVCILAPKVIIKNDLFENIANVDLYPQYLKKEIREFSKITLEHIQKGFCIDLLNTGNIAIVSDNNNEHHLKLIDPHVVFVIEKLKDLERKKLDEKINQLQMMALL